MTKFKTSRDFALFIIEQMVNIEGPDSADIAVKAVSGMLQAAAALTAVGSRGNEVAMEKCCTAFRKAFKSNAECQQTPEFKAAADAAYGEYILNKMVDNSTLPN